MIGEKSNMAWNTISIRDKCKISSEEAYQKMKSMKLSIATGKTYKQWLAENNETEDNGTRDAYWSLRGYHGPR